MTGTVETTSTIQPERANAATLADVATRAEAAARDLIALAPTPQQRGTVALVALHAIEREFAKAVRS